MKKLTLLPALLLLSMCAAAQQPVTASQSTATNLKAEVVGPTADNAVNPSAKISALPAVANAAQPSWTEAHVAPLSSDLTGNLRVLPGQPALSTGTIVASNSTVTVNTLGYGIATVTVHGTYSGVNFAFKFSDDGGTTYYNTTCSRSDSSTQETTSGVLADNTSRAWDCSVYAATQFRIAASAYTSGTATIGITLSGHAIEAAPTVAIATGSNTIGALTANQSVNVAQVNAHTTVEATTGVQLVGIEGRAGTSLESTAGVIDQNVKNVGNSAVATAATGVQKVGVVGNAGAAVDAAMAAAVPANGVQVGMRGSGAAGAPVMTAPIVCDNWKPFSVSSTTSTVLVAKVASKQVYICSINLVVAGASNVAIIEGTKVTTECDTATAGMAGGTTAATGWNFAANGGLAQGSGVGVIMATATTGHDVCILQSGSVQLSGVISWAQF